MSNPTRAQAEAAYEKLQDAADVFMAAITEFQNVYNPNTVSLNGWCEGIDGTLLEIYDDIEENIQE